MPCGAMYGSDGYPKGEGPGSCVGGSLYWASAEVEIQLTGPSTDELDAFCAICGGRDECEDGVPWYCWEENHHPYDDECQEHDHQFVRATAELGQLLPQLMGQISELALQDPPKAVELVKGCLDLTRMTAEQATDLSPEDEAKLAALATTVSAMVKANPTLTRD